MFNSIQAYPYSTFRQVEISFLGMPQIAHFQVEKWESSLPSPAPSLRSLAKIAPPKCFGSLRHWCPPPQCVDPRYATVHTHKTYDYIFPWSDIFYFTCIYFLLHFLFYLVQENPKFRYILNKIRNCAIQRNWCWLLEIYRNIFKDSFKLTSSSLLASTSLTPGSGLLFSSDASLSCLNESSATISAIILYTESKI